MSKFRFLLMEGLISAEIRWRGYKIKEGASSPEELLCLYETAKRTGAKNIAEIGFHLGFSSYAFLKSNRKVRVTSFDIGTHPFIPLVKKIIDRKFPGRHTLVYGDSTKTVPEFTRQNPDLKFDLIFIDGGHEYKIARADIANMRLLARPGTGIIIDDLTPWLPWGKGPTQAWTEAIQNKVIIQRELYKDGKKVDTIEPPGARSWALGNYIFLDIEEHRRMMQNKK